MAKRYILGVFDDDHVIVEATKKIKSEGVHVDDVLSPFPMHGIDDALGLKETRLHTSGFIFGLMGCIFILAFISWINVSNYPIIFGGKPYWAVLGYIPVTFEVTVLFASVGMVIAFFLRCGLTAIRPQEPLDERITNDKFVMAFDMTDRDSKEEQKIKKLLQSHGAIEVNEKIQE